MLCEEFNKKWRRKLALFEDNTRKLFISEQEKAQMDHHS